MIKNWKCLIGFLGIFFLLTSLSLAKGKKWAVLQPVSGRKITVQISGKESEYFVLEKNGLLEIKINGPAQLKIFSRLNFTSVSSSSREYSLEIKKENQIIKSYSTSSNPSSAVYKDYTGVPGKSRKFFLDVPDGLHSYVIRTVNAPTEVLLRFLILSASAKNKLTSLTPLDYDKVVIANINEKPISYYTCTSKKPVRVKVIGPTKLIIESRLNFESNMKGKQKYLLLIEENEKNFRKQALETTKSLTVVYQNLETVVPGESKTFYLDIPSGQHIYSFQLGESLGHSTSLRFSIPEKDLKNEG